MIPFFAETIKVVPFIIDILRILSIGPILHSYLLPILLISIRPAVKMASCLVTTINISPSTFANSIVGKLILI